MIRFQRKPATIWHEVDRLLDHLVRETAAGAGAKPEVAEKETVKPNRPALRPAANVTEHESAFEVAIALPGVPKDGIEVKFEEGTLVVAGKRPVEEGLKYRYREFATGDFERRFQLPVTVEVNAISGRFENGILTLTLPKKAPKVVTVQ